MEEQLVPIGNRNKLFQPEIGRVTTLKAINGERCFNLSLGIVGLKTWGSKEVHEIGELESVAESDIMIKTAL